MKVGIRVRLVISLVALMTVALGLTAIVLINDADKRIEWFKHTQALSQAKTLAEGSLDALVTRDYEQLERLVKSALPSEEYAYASLVKTDGQVLTHTDLSLIGSFVPTSREIAAGKFYDVKYKDQPVVEVVYSSAIGDKIFANAHVAYYQNVPNEQREDTLNTLIIIMLVSTLAMIGGVIFLTDKIMQPVRHLTDTISNFSLEKGIKFSPAILNRKDEIGALALSFDDLSYRLSHSYKELKKKSDELEEKVKKRTRVLEEHSVELERTNNELYETQKELQQHRDNLQKRVDERTLELKQARDAAFEARDQAELANRTKSEFLANMSHELRTPMHAVLGFANLGKEKLDPEKDVQLIEMFEHILKSGDRLMHLLNNLLDLARMEAGYSELHLGENDLPSLIDMYIQGYQEEMQAKHLTVDTKYSSAENNTIFDGKMIGQVVDNLIGNAVKFSAVKSTIRIGVVDQTMDTATEKNIPCIHFSITNLGISIPEDELEQIFDNFIQSTATKTGAGGTGLGLSISRSIIAAHKGKIWAENLMPDGVVFHFIIPMQPLIKEIDLSAQPG